MNIEDEAIKFLRGMDDETQVVAVRMLRGLARDFPRGPKLHLVHSAPTNVVTLNLPSGGTNPLLILGG